MQPDDFGLPPAVVTIALQKFDHGSEMSVMVAVFKVQADCLVFELGISTDTCWSFGAQKLVWNNMLETCKMLRKRANQKGLQQDFAICGPHCLLSAKSNSGIARALQRGTKQHSSNTPFA